MGSVGNEVTEVVMRQDISKLTPSQRKVMERVYDNVEFARTHSPLEWGLRQRYDRVTLDGMDDYILVKRYADYNFKSAEDAKERMLREAQEYADEYRKYYENLKKGIALTYTSSNTLRALESRGYIRIIEDGKSYTDTVEIIERRR